MAKDTESKKKPVNSKNKNVKEFKINLDPRTIFLAILIFFIGLTFYSSFNADQSKNSQEKSITQVVNDIQEKKVKTVEIDGNTVNVTYKNGTEAKAIKEEGESFISILSDSKIDSFKEKAEVVFIELEHRSATERQLVIHTL